MHLVIVPVVAMAVTVAMIVAVPVVVTGVVTVPVVMTVTVPVIVTMPIVMAVVFSATITPTTAAVPIPVSVSMTAVLWLIRHGGQSKGGPELGRLGQLGFDGLNPLGLTQLHLNRGKSAVVRGDFGRLDDCGGCLGLKAKRYLAHRASGSIG